MGRRKKKKSYRQACATDIANGNSSKFTKACVKRFPDLATEKKATKKK